MNDIAGSYPLGTKTTKEAALSTCTTDSKEDCGWNSEDKIFTYPKAAGGWSNKQYCDGASSLVTGMGAISFLISLNWYYLISYNSKSSVEKY